MFECVYMCMSDCACVCVCVWVCVCVYTKFTLNFDNVSLLLTHICWSKHLLFFIRTFLPKDIFQSQVFNLTKHVHTSAKIPYKEVQCHLLLVYVSRTTHSSSCRSVKFTEVTKKAMIVATDMLKWNYFLRFCFCCEIVARFNMNRWKNLWNVNHIPAVALH